jgi:chemotaxis protein MotB
MKVIAGTLLAVVFVVFAGTGCVPGGKYKTLHKKSVDFMNERDDFKADNLELSMKNREMEARLAAIESELTGMEEQRVVLQKEAEEARADYNTLNNRYIELQKAQEDLIRGNVAETRRLLQELQAAQENLQNKEEILRQLESGMEARRAELDELTFELEKRSARLMELERILDAQQNAVRELKKKVSDALFGFENNGLTVTQKNGKVYVSLDEKLLFRTGSYNIDANGRDALRKLATLLARNPDIQITIEGHTDDVPYISSGGPIQDNWDLSVKRATTVVRVLLEGSGIDPNRLTASGRGEYMPVDDRKTADARQKNRRTEIILTPDLDELYRIIESF